MRRIPALLLPLLVAPAPPASAEEPPPKPAPPPAPRAEPGLPARVDAAIAKGVARLRSRQSESGEFQSSYRPIPIPGAAAQASNTSWIGQTALGLYTMRSCDVPFDDPGVKRGFAWLREEYLRRKYEPRGLDNYGVSLTVLALEAHYDPPPPSDGDARRTGRAGPAGSPIPPADMEWLRELTGWIVAAQDPAGGFGYRTPAIGYHDHSNTQYSLLALKAARRCGVPVPQKTWERAARHLVQAQERGGPEVIRGESPEAGPGTATAGRARDHARGWGYTDGDPATGSMTAGGVSSLAICRSELRGKPGWLPKDDAPAEQGFHDGLAWLGLHFTVRENPGPDAAPMASKSWLHYWLYGLERAGVFAEAESIGGHDWYAEGAEFLLSAQTGDGGWTHGEEMLETCFSLLFLKKATARLTRAVPTGERLDLSGAADLEEAPFAALFDRVFGRFAAAGAERRAALAADFVRLGTRSLPLLVRRLEDTDPAAREAALDALRRTTGETLGFDPGAPDADRAKAVDRWGAWWAARKDELEADVAAGRFVAKPR